MKNKPLFDSNEILKAFNEAIKEGNKDVSLSSAYIDKDGNLKMTPGISKKIKPKIK